MDSACTLSARLGNNSCVVGWPFTLVGVALIATGVISVLIALLTPRRAARRGVAALDQSSISTLPQHDEDSLRDVA